MKIKKIVYDLIFSLNIFSSIVLQINGQVIVPMKKNLNSYYIKILYEKDKNKSEFIRINMALDYTFIPFSQMTDSNIYSDDELIELDNKEYNTKLIWCNNLFLENNNDYNLNNFYFYTMDKSQLNKESQEDNSRYLNLYRGQLGLSPFFDDDNLNILQSLKQKFIINKMSFGFSFSSKQGNEDILYLGEIEEKNEILKNKNIITVFDMNKKLIKKYNKWGFKLDAIVLEKTTGLTKNIKHKYFAYFNIIEDRIFVPDKIMEYLISRIFNAYIKNNICFITEYSDKKFINCFKKKLQKEKKNFPNIIFVVNNYSFKLTYDDLFINSVNNNEMIFIIQKNYYDIDTSIILFGSRFIKKYITEFNIEESKIIFHSENIIPIINLDKIEDDSWKDMIRDYNKETEHYDSNYGNDKEEEIEDENEEDDNDTTNINNNHNTNSDNMDNDNIINNKGKSENENNQENKDNINNNNYGIYLKIILGIFIIIIVFVSIFIFFKVRKKIRINNEKDYFKQPLNKTKDDE